MDSLRLNVTPRNIGYVAESLIPEVSAEGSSAQEAAENARLVALALYPKGARPDVLIVCVKEPGACTIIMQSINKALSLAPQADAGDWRYIASVTNGDISLEQKTAKEVHHPL
jgi:hypothetical protein